eukprot:11253489-Alexandrium_andersonii.AAC.1
MAPLNHEKLCTACSAWLRHGHDNNYAALAAMRAQRLYYPRTHCAITVAMVTRGRRPSRVTLPVPRWSSRGGQAEGDCSTSQSFSASASAQ